MFQLANKGINLKIGEYQKIYIKKLLLSRVHLFSGKFRCISCWSFVKNRLEEEENRDVVSNGEALRLSVMLE